MYQKKMLEKERRVRRQDEDSGERHGNKCFSKWQTSQIQPTLFDPKMYETAVRLFSKYYYKRFMNIWKIWWNVCSNSVHRLDCCWYKEVKQLEKLYDSVKQRTQVFLLKRWEKERKGKERGKRVAECEKNITLACYYIINVIILFHIYHLYILKQYIYIKFLHEYNCNHLRGGNIIAVQDGRINHCE